MKPTQVWQKQADGSYLIFWPGGPVYGLSLWTGARPVR